MLVPEVEAYILPYISKSSEIRNGEKGQHFQLRIPIGTYKHAKYTCFVNIYVLF